MSGVANKCSMCNKDGTHEVRVVNDVLKGHESSEFFCSPGCMTMMMAASEKSFMPCDVCGKYIRAYNEDGYKQVFVVKKKVLCIKCYLDLLFRFGQPLAEIITKPPIAGVPKYISGKYLKDGGFMPIEDGRGLSRERLTNAIPKMLAFAKNKHLIIIKENPNNTYTIWTKLR